LGPLSLGLGLGLEQMGLDNMSALDSVKANVLMSVFPHHIVHSADAQCGRV